MSKTHTSFLEVNPKQLSFGNTALFTSSGEQEVVLRNTGWSDIVFRDIEVVGDYQLDRSGCPTVLRPDQTAKLLVSFVPSSLGSPSGELIIDAGRAGHFHVELRGTSNLPFGNIAVHVETLAELNSPEGLAFGDGYYAMVVDDPLAANNGIWKKEEGSWVGPITAFLGPQGTPGDPGPAGPQGDQGDPGPQGPPADTTVIAGHEAAAQAAEDAARAEALAAAGSASSAAGYATNSQTSADAAAGSATAASAAVGVAQSARDDAQDHAQASFAHAQAAQTQANGAASSAGAALQASVDAQAARDDANVNADAAAGHEFTAGTYADDAGNSAATATQQATLAANSENAAAGSASAAATSATNAATSATNAGTSATAAENSRLAAETAESNASISETNAATSETNAAGSASSASSSATLAATASNEAQENATGGLGLGFNPNFELPRGWYGSSNQTSAHGSDHYVTTSQGPTFRTDLDGAISAIGERFAVDTSRRYRFKTRLYADDALSRCYVGFVAYDESGAVLPGNAGTHTYTATGGQANPGAVWTDYEGDAQGEDSTGNGRFPIGTKFIAPLVYLNLGGHGVGYTYCAYVTIDDVTESYDAEAQATIATDQAVSASASAASAQASAVLAASLTTGFYNKNAFFADWPDAGLNPTGWSVFGPAVTRVDNFDESVSPYSLRQATVDPENAYIRLTGPWPTNARTGDWVVARFEFTLVAGKLDLTEFRVRERNSAGSLVVDNSFHAYTDPDVNGVVHGSGVVGRRYTYEFLVQLSNPNTERTDLLAMTRYEPGAVGPDLTTPVTIDWHTVGIRKATQAEIETGTVLPAVEASVTTVQSAVADLEEAAAHLRQVVAASGSNPAMMELLAGKDGSAIGLLADRVSLGNNVDGVIQDVLTIEDGVAKLNNALIRKLKVLPRTDSLISMDVALAPLIVTGKDGDTILYSGGATFGAEPERIEPYFEDLPALSSGERWAITTNKGLTSFVPSVQKITSGTFSQATSVGSSLGVLPTYRTNKVEALDAYNGQYTFSIPITSSVTYSFMEGIDTYTHEARGDLYIWIGGVPVLVGSYDETWIYYGANGSSTRTISRTVNISDAVGAVSPGFGVEPTEGGAGYPTVTWEIQTAGSPVTVNDVIRWKVFAPPRN